ncbi:MAG: SDR family NAD(P)-dependent oxidoreductase [Anaerolineae bacterium]|nr:SDR family NAD(P)-dependent oxidoreductase [Anaerolineae bacterium]
MKSYVLITGASGGLGKAFAAECASRGWNLFLTDLAEQPLATAATGIERLYGVEVLHHTCDLTDAASREALWQHIGRSRLSFHMLINVAGIDYEGPFDERKVDELCAIVRLNIEATVDTTRRILPFRDPARTLRIVNVSSLAGYYPMPIKAVYAASKRFLLDFSLALNQELRAGGVTVTALCPAGMPTNPICIRAIDAQGFAGWATTMNVGDVAARTVDMALAGRSVYVPGAVNQALRWLGALVPPSVIAFVINRRWRESYRKSHSVPARPQRSSPEQASI